MHCLWAMRTLLALGLIACGSTPPVSTTATVVMEQVVVMEVIPADAESVAAAAPSPSSEISPYPEDIRSVLVLRTTVLHKEPSFESAAVGVIKRGTYAGVRDTAIGDSDCPKGRWIELAPRGWACESALEPSGAVPTAPSQVSLTDEVEPEPIRATYGIVRGANVEAFTSRADAQAKTNGRVLAGSNTVRAAGVIDVDGRRYWRTSKGDLIDQASIRRISPSSFKGVALGDSAALPAWVRSSKGSRESVTIRATASGRANSAGTLAPRAVVTILEQSEDGSFVRIADGQWVARADLRMATLAAPPPGTQPDEKWFDIDRDQQVLVAYEGERPVYATLVSTGKYRHETPTGITRVVSKHASATMTSEKNEIYSVADVPWTMYFDRDFALHTSFWHDGFGGPRSHGCVNLAPRDALLLYRWSSPDVPPGWTSVYGDETSPGSLVRVRTTKVPNPRFRGYARAIVGSVSAS